MDVQTRENQARNHCCSSMALRKVIALCITIACLHDHVALCTEIYEDSNQPVELRVQDLLSRMTLDEKIGQMTQIERYVANFDVMKNFSIGLTFSYVSVY